MHYMARRSLLTRSSCSLCSHSCSLNELPQKSSFSPIAPSRFLFVWWEGLSFGGKNSHSVSKLGTQRSSSFPHTYKPKGKNFSPLHLWNSRCSSSSFLIYPTPSEIHASYSSSSFPFRNVATANDLCDAWQNSHIDTWSAIDSSSIYSAVIMMSRIRFSFCEKEMGLGPRRTPRGASGSRVDILAALCFTLIFSPLITLAIITPWSATFVQGEEKVKVQALKKKSLTHPRFLTLWMDAILSSIVSSFSNGSQGCFSFFAFISHHQRHLFVSPRWASPPYSSILWVQTLLVNKPDGDEWALNSMIRCIFLLENEKETHSRVSIGFEVPSGLLVWINYFNRHDWNQNFFGGKRKKFAKNESLLNLSMMCVCHTLQGLSTRTEKAKFFM